MIRFQCACGKRLKVDDAHAGRTVKCGACGAQITAPATSQEVAAPSEGLDALAQALSTAAPKPAGGAGAAARPGQPKAAAGKAPGRVGQANASLATSGSKMPFYIGLGIAGGVLVVAIVAAVLIHNSNTEPPVDPKPVIKIAPTETKPKKPTHTPGEMFPDVPPSN